MLKVLRQILFLQVALLLHNCCTAQSQALNFRHITVKQGLNDGIINAIMQDKYGYMWFASYGALNRFNGMAVKKFEHIPGDSNSAPGGIVHTLYKHSDGRFFAGGDEGLVEFDYATERFHRISAFNKERIIAVNETGNGELLVVAGNKLYRYSLSGKTKTIVSSSAKPGFFEQRRIFSLFRKGNQYYAGTAGGYIVYNTQSGRADYHEIKLLKGQTADEVMADALDNIWVNNIFSFKLIRVDAKTGNETAIDQLPSIAAKGVQQSFLNFTADKDNVWIVTSLTGLIQYNIHTGAVLRHQKNILRPGSIAENILRTIYTTADGTIWISLLGGVDYFHPEKTIFDVLFPFPSFDANQLSRGFAEDRDGYYWFTTGDGVTRYNKQNGTYRIWRNEAERKPAIYYNSSRAVLADGNNIWIATGKGINRYDAANDRMHFMTAKDSLPELFYLNINKDSKGFIWFCTNMADGLYYFDPADKKIHSIRQHTFLKKYTGYGVRRVFEDSRKRLWLGFAGAGFAMYDPLTAKTKYWYNSAGSDSSFNSNLIIDITEDKKGIVWLTTFNGVQGVDTDNDKTYRLSVADGLPSNVTNGIMTDAYNRLWISTSGGLVLVDSSRKNIYRFDESYGFPAMEFPEHQAHITSDGFFIFPSNKGYIRFNPAKVPQQINTFPFFISTVSVFDKPISAGTDFKLQSGLSLSHRENFFSITLEALNYSNPEQTWYAYKLDGLEKEWHYSQNPRATYTSVPGGNYTFRYKAAAGPDFNGVEEKTLSVHLGTVFYKTNWFRILAVLLLSALVYVIYIYRLRQKEKLFVLEGKAQQLEKEKAQVMYESLKQQLNPHFLFNSLSSLSGLIETDQELAGNFLDQMSKIYRYILKSRDSETVKLKEEIDFTQTYVGLQRTRFSRGFEVNVEVEEEALEKRIPPVTLQNMIENAIKHNIIDAGSPLVINISSSDGYLLVKNNLQKKQMVETSNKQGLASLQSLYSYLSSKPVIIEETTDTFCIKLPLI